MGSLSSWIDSVPVTSIIAVVVAVAGACVVIFGHGLAFGEYIQDIGPLVGLVAVGRGIHRNGQKAHTK